MKFLSLLFLFVSLNVHAGNDAFSQKPFTVGGGVYVSTLGFDDATFQDEEYSGLGLSLGYAFTNFFAVRGTYFSQENDDFSDNTSKGIDLFAYFGSHLATRGFKGYGGVGFFRDTQQFTSSSETFDGLQLGGGIGYNWDSVALDFTVLIRDSSDYEARLNNTEEMTVASGSLIVSYRF